MKFKKRIIQKYFDRLKVSEYVFSNMENKKEMTLKCNQDERIIKA